jgi:deoxycytidylate deaminase
MAAAYACSQESTCLKRKVGAIVVDSSGSIISSGRNDVPRDSRSCSSVYGKCYKDYFREQFVESAINEKLITKNKKQGFIKLLKDKIGLHDICQAVHAEENVILNLTRTGSMVPLETCTLYTTTYPCRQCARRIVNLGIKRICYLEAYPDEAAAKILEDANVGTKLFEGITFRAYFRIYGEKK